MKEDHLYIFGHNSHYKKIFTWAASIIAQSEMIVESCPQCGRYAAYPSGAFDVVCEGGREYPDVLGCGAYPFLIVSERVTDAWTETGIKPYHTFPVRITDVRSSKLLKEAAPRYFRVEIDGECRIDLAASGFDIAESCSTCGQIKITRKGFDYSFVMIPDSWDGSPVFRDAAQFPRVSFCTQMLLNIAQINHLTNFRFEPMQGTNSSSAKGIDYTKGER